MCDQNTLARDSNNDKTNQQNKSMRFASTSHQISAKGTEHTEDK